jgi:Resolvase, N terminal domain
VEHRGTLHSPSSWRERAIRLSSAFRGQKSRPCACLPLVLEHDFERAFVSVRWTPARPKTKKQRLTPRKGWPRGAPIDKPKTGPAPLDLIDRDRLDLINRKPDLTPLTDPDLTPLMTPLTDTLTLDDRLGWSLTRLIEPMVEMEAERIGSQSVSESIDSTAPGGKPVFHSFGALAEFERNQIRERTYMKRTITNGRWSPPVWSCTFCVKTCSGLASPRGTLGRRGPLTNMP